MTSSKEETVSITDIENQAREVLYQALAVLQSELETGKPVSPSDPFGYGRFDAAIQVIDCIGRLNTAQAA